MTEEKYKICSNCVMDTTDPDIHFDEQGVCNHCHDFINHQKPQLLGGEAGDQALASMVERIKSDGKGLDYDCIIGISGGVDSSYVAYRVLQLGLRPLAVHVDTGWNSELAVSNIEKIVTRLDIDLHTTVIDWDEMRDLQLAFLRSGVANCDVPQDHTFVAVLFKLAAKLNIKWIISGHNLQTESILPEAWGYISIDRKHLLSIHKKFGRKKLNKFPLYNLFEYIFYWPYIKKIKILKLLNYEDYDKNRAKEFLMNEFDWRDYGGKHYESRFTKFFQSYYLPKKFGYDKRRAHAASLVVSGQLSRNDAIASLLVPPYADAEASEDCAYIAKKLGVTAEYVQQMIDAAPKSFRDYPSNDKLIQQLLAFKTRIQNVTRNTKR